MALITKLYLAYEKTLVHVFFPSLFFLKREMFLKQRNLVSIPGVILLWNINIKTGIIVILVTPFSERELV
jgi:hypothetical protein